MSQHDVDGEPSPDDRRDGGFSPLLGREAESVMTLCEPVEEELNVAWRRLELPTHRELALSVDWSYNCRQPLKGGIAYIFYCMRSQLISFCMLSPAD